MFFMAHWIPAAEVEHARHNGAQPCAYLSCYKRHLCWLVQNKTETFSCQFLGTAKVSGIIMRCNLRHLIFNLYKFEHLQIVTVLIWLFLVPNSHLH